MEGLEDSVRRTIRSAVEGTTEKGCGRRTGNRLMGFSKNPGKVPEREIVQPTTYPVPQRIIGTRVKLVGGHRCFAGPPLCLFFITIMTPIPRLGSALSACLIAFTLSQPAAAQGDSCATATPISGSGVFPWDNTTATSSGTGCIGNNDLFWSWTPSVSGDYLVELIWPGPNSSFDTSLGVYEGAGCGLTQPVGCNVAPFARGGVRIGGATPQETYVIQISAWQAGVDIGSAELHILPAPCTAPNFIDDPWEDNDTLAQAVPLPTGLTTNLFIVAGDPDFYSLTIPAGQELQIQPVGLSGYHEFWLYHSNGALVGPRYNGVYYGPQSGSPLDVIVELRWFPGLAERDNCREYDLDVQFQPSDPRFMSFCNPSAPNSAGRATILNGWVNAPQYGSRVTLGSFNGPFDQFGYFLVANQFADPGIPLGLGELCLTGTIARYNVAGSPLDSLGEYDHEGIFQNVVGTGFFGYGFIPPDDLPAPFGMILAGETWNFQVWHREPGGQSHLSNGLSVQF